MKTLQDKIKDFSMKYFNDSEQDALEYSERAILNPELNILADLQNLSRGKSSEELDGFIQEVTNFFDGDMKFSENQVESIKNRHAIVTNWEQNLEKEDSSYILVPSKIGFSLSSDDLKDLATLHKKYKNLRKKIEYILSDCNFHSECSDFSSSNYRYYLK